MNNENREDKIKAVQKVLGEPFGCEFSDKAWKIRTNLIIVSVISICLSLAKLHIDQGSSIFGLKFTGLSDDVVRSVLYWITLYLLVHFVWCSIDNLLEWRLRITGTRTAFVTTGRIASDEGDYPNDPRQSTLYHWWKEESHQVGNIGARSAAIEKKLVEWEHNIQGMCSVHKDCGSIAVSVNTINNVLNDISRMKKDVENTAKIFESDRIPASLERFDNWFMLLLRSQNLRWLLMEFSFPILIGITALYLLKYF